MAKILTAYFSVSGCTKKAAEKLAALCGADLFEICPETPYTKEDLDYTNPKARTTLEMQDLNCRPALSGSVNDMAAYDTVIVGFPVWWGREPSIIDTFLETYDLSGKKLILFATSAQSGIDDAAKRIPEICGVPAEKCMRFGSAVSEEELKEWAESISK